MDVENIIEMRERNVVENLLDVEGMSMLRDPDNYEKLRRKKKGIKVKLGGSDSQEASSSTGNHTTEVTRRRFLNESVLDCGRIVKKIPPRELVDFLPVGLVWSSISCPTYVFS